MSSLNPSTSTLDTINNNYNSLQNSPKKIYEEIVCTICTMVCFFLFIKIVKDFNQ